MKPHPDKPHRLSEIFSYYNPPVYFVTFCTADRKPILSNDSVHQKFCNFSENAIQHGVAIGQYVIMPDHIHCFIRMAPDQTLGTTIRLIKRSLSAAITDPLPHWQPGFFDHLLRHSESYSEKWNYVKNNPVCDGLVRNPDDWPYQGQITEIRY
ncbi:REP-associated tyrosine transposase [Tichowtungia aerotolerans]|uniref:Transposase IS200-like domain-containing protein n=1 Tax=Tichowtungia aerotolerans TaxID=2697043 RepID=A0A6P1M470_9BACT|nr:transposase [Tichowtungia aerotolerans]QHI68641.1 hypothetical protein GT409_04000 [Tichowtungia aerotolerans]